MDTVRIWALFELEKSVYLDHQCKLNGQAGQALFRKDSVEDCSLVYKVTADQPCSHRHKETPLHITAQRQGRLIYLKKDSSVPRCLHVFLPSLVGGDGDDTSEGNTDAIKGSRMNPQRYIHSSNEHPTNINSQGIFTFLAFSYTVDLNSALSSNVQHPYIVNHIVEP